MLEKKKKWLSKERELESFSRCEIECALFALRIPLKSHTLSKHIVNYSVYDFLCESNYKPLGDRLQFVYLQNLTMRLQRKRNQISDKRHDDYLLLFICTFL